MKFDSQREQPAPNSHLGHPEPIRGQGQRMASASNAIYEIKSPSLSPTEQADLERPKLVGTYSPTASEVPFNALPVAGDKLTIDKIKVQDAFKNMKQVVPPVNRVQLKKVSRPTIPPPLVKVAKPTQTADDHKFSMLLAVSKPQAATLEPTVEHKIRQIMATQHKTPVVRDEHVKLFPFPKKAMANKVVNIPSNRPSVSYSTQIAQASGLKPAFEAPPNHLIVRPSSPSTTPKIPERRPPSSPKPKKKTRPAPGLKASASQPNPNWLVAPSLDPPKVKPILIRAVNANGIKVSHTRPPPVSQSQQFQQQLQSLLHSQQQAQPHKLSFMSNDRFNPNQQASQQPHRLFSRKALFSSLPSVEQLMSSMSNIRTMFAPKQVAPELSVPYGRGVVVSGLFNSKPVVPGPPKFSSPVKGLPNPFAGNTFPGSAQFNLPPGFSRPTQRPLDTVRSPVVTPVKASNTFKPAMSAAFVTSTTTARPYIHDLSVSESQRSKLAVSFAEPMQVKVTSSISMGTKGQVETAVRGHAKAPDMGNKVNSVMLKELLSKQTSKWDKDKLSNHSPKASRVESEAIVGQRSLGSSELVNKTTESTLHTQVHPNVLFTKLHANKSVTDDVNGTKLELTTVNVNSNFSQPIIYNRNRTLSELSSNLASKLSTSSRFEKILNSLWVAKEILV